MPCRDETQGHNPTKRRTPTPPSSGVREPVSELIGHTLSVIQYNNKSYRVLLNYSYEGSTATKMGARGWLRHCATSRKVAGSIPGGVIGIFH